MNKTTEALKMAQTYLRNKVMQVLPYDSELGELLTTIQEALESQEQENCAHIGMDKCKFKGVCKHCQEQEPVAWMLFKDGIKNGVSFDNPIEKNAPKEWWIKKGYSSIPLYTHPAQPLTQEIYEQLKNQSTQWTSSLPMLMHLINKHFGIDDGLDWGQQAHGIGVKNEKI